jgi:hypothetical protein
MPSRDVEYILLEKTGNAAMDGIRSELEIG